MVPFLPLAVPAGASPTARGTAPRKETVRVSRDATQSYCRRSLSIGRTSALRRPHRVTPPSPGAERARRGDKSPPPSSPGPASPPEPRRSRGARFGPRDATSASRDRRFAPQDGRFGPGGERGSPRDGGVGPRTASVVPRRGPALPRKGAPRGRDEGSRPPCVRTPVISDPEPRASDPESRSRTHSRTLFSLPGVPAGLLPSGSPPRLARRGERARLRARSGVAGRGSGIGVRGSGGSKGRNGRSVLWESIVRGSLETRRRPKSIMFKK